MREPPSLLLGAPPDVNDEAARLWMQDAKAKLDALDRWMRDILWPKVRDVHAWWYPRFSAAEKQAFTVTNLTTDRSYDADTAVVAETNDVLGTLINDLGLKA